MRYQANFFTFVDDLQVGNSWFGKDISNNAKCSLSLARMLSTTV